MMSKKRPIAYDEVKVWNHFYRRKLSKKFPSLALTHISYDLFFFSFRNIKFQYLLPLIEIKSEEEEKNI